MSAQVVASGEPKVPAEMGASVNNLTAWLHRARRALTGRLEEMCKTCLEDTFLDSQCGSIRRGSRVSSMQFARSLAGSELKAKKRSTIGAPGRVSGLVGNHFRKGLLNRV